MRTSKKRLLSVLLLAVCAMVLSACGGKKADKLNLNADMMAQYSDNLLTFQKDLTAEELTMLLELDEDILATQVGLGENSFISGTALAASLQSWESAVKELKEVEGFGAGYVDSDDGKTVTYIVPVTGAGRTAKVEFIFDKLGKITAATTNVDYSFGEKMQKAGLNTLLGMGTVFAVLILISLIIGLFAYIPKIEASMKSRKQDKSPAPAVQAAPVVQEAEEDVTDDLELVAVISAAIAASEGAASTDGFVVRSVRKVNRNKWQNA